MFWVFEEKGRFCSDAYLRAFWCFCFFLNDRLETKEEANRNNPIPKLRNIKYNASKQYALSPYPSCSVKLGFVCFSFSVSTHISISLSRCRAQRIRALWLLCHPDCLSTTVPGNPAQNFQASSSAAAKPQESWIQPTVSRFTGFLMPTEKWMAQWLPRLLASWFESGELGEPQLVQGKEAQEHLRWVKQWDIYQPSQDWYH